MFVGAIGCGKTTLTQRLSGADIVYSKTQDIKFLPYIIDTPGEFVQYRSRYNSLIVSANNVDVIGLVFSAKEKSQIFSPLFTSMFNKPTVGIITKIDLATHEEIMFAESNLKLAGVKQIFNVSSTEDIGIKELLEYLQ